MTRFPAALRDAEGRASAAASLDLAKIAKEKGITYFLISYVDLFGALRAKLVPAAAAASAVS